MNDNTMNDNTMKDNTMKDNTMKDNTMNDNTIDDNIKNHSSIQIIENYHNQIINKFIVHSKQLLDKVKVHILDLVKVQESTRKTPPTANLSEGKQNSESLSLIEKAQGTQQSSRILGELSNNIIDDPIEEFNRLMIKLEHIYLDINDIVSRMNRLMVEIDDKSINLTLEDHQRIELDKHTREMFNAFAPYFFMYNICKDIYTV